MTRSGRAAARRARPSCGRSERCRATGRDSSRRPTAPERRTSPCHSQRSLLRRDPRRRGASATRRGTGHRRCVVVGERANPSSSSSAARWLVAGPARRGAGGLRDLGTSTPLVEACPRTAPPRNASRYVSRASSRSSGSSRRAAASSSGGASLPRLDANAIWARSSSTRARWNSSSGPASAMASRPSAASNAPAWTFA